MKNSKKESMKMASSDNGPWLSLMNRLGVNMFGVAHLYD